MKFVKVMLIIFLMEKNFVFSFHIKQIKMKKLLILPLLFIGAISMNANAQTEVSKDTGAKIEFVKEVHDYGKLKYAGDPFCTFDFKNTGNEPLIISNAKGSCGCTVPTWPKEPIAPGATGTIKVKYDTKRPGPINKSVTITSNAINTPTKVLRIKGEVGQAPKSGAPVNTSGAPAKQ